MRTIAELCTIQKEYFLSGKTLPVQNRITNLKILRDCIQSNEQAICEALRADLGKSETESYMCEIGMAICELNDLIKNLKKWSKPKRVKTPMAQFSSKSYTIATPYGNTLIMSPWNYPFLLTIDPLATAIAAGNTAIVKPSAYSAHTSALIKKLLDEHFDEGLIATVTGGRAENAALLESKFDMIFFTGSQAVGKEVLRHAAEYLTPAVLELGGKSPCIVDETAKISLSAKRIVFGKFLNCGQTCVAPDYILCHTSIKERLIEEIKREITAQFGEKPLENPNYGKIISRKHFERVCALIDEEKIVFGGGMDASKEKIGPTVMDNVTWEDGVMQEEIFGPVLPILTFDDFNEVYTMLQDKPKPLALYLFSEDKKRWEEVPQRIRYGGGCINDVIIHLATSAMGFGGVGESGMGAYHGKRGFETFSHIKSILNKKTWIDLPMRYQPYTEKHKNTIKKFMK